jgi:antitoxin HicB
MNKEEKMKGLKYSALVRPLSKEEGGGYFVEIPELPGCIADGETIEEAFAEAKSAIESWIHTAKEFGDPIPNPSIDKRYSGQWRLRVPKSLHAALALRAKQEGVSLNLLTATILAEGLEHKWHQHKSCH